MGMRDEIARLLAGKAAAPLAGKPSGMLCAINYGPWQALRLTRHEGRSDG